MKALSIVIGVIYAILGVLCFFAPVFTASIFAYIIAAAIIAGGLYLVVSYFTNKGDKSVWSIIGGILAIILGIILIMHPGYTGMLVSSFFGAWMLFSGISRIAQSFSQKDAGAPWGLTMTMGILTIIAGLFLIFHPFMTFILIGILIGFSLLFEGINFIMAGSKM